MFNPSFRLSLTVLVHYRYTLVFSLGVWLPRIPTKYVLHGTWEQTTSDGQKFHLHGYHVLWLAFPDNSITLIQFLGLSRNPSLPCGIWFRLFRFRSPLTYGISFDLFSCPYLDVSVQGVPHRAYASTLHKGGVSPFGHRRIKAS